MVDATIKRGDLKQVGPITLSDMSKRHTRHLGRAPRKKKKIKKRAGHFFFLYIYYTYTADETSVSALIRFRPSSSTFRLRRRRRPDDVITSHLFYIYFSMSQPLDSTYCTMYIDKTVVNRNLFSLAIQQPIRPTDAAAKSNAKYRTARVASAAEIDLDIFSK